MFFPFHPSKDAYVWPNLVCEVGGTMHSISLSSIHTETPQLTLLQVSSHM